MKHSILNFYFQYTLLGGVFLNQKLYILFLWICINVQFNSPSVIFEMFRKLSISYNRFPPQHFVQRFYIYLYVISGFLYYLPLWNKLGKSQFPSPTTIARINSAGSAGSAVIWPTFPLTWWETLPLYSHYKCKLFDWSDCTHVALHIKSERVCGGEDIGVCQYGTQILNSDGI